MSRYIVTCRLGPDTPEDAMVVVVNPDGTEPLVFDTWQDASSEMNKLFAQYPDVPYAIWEL